MNFCLDPGHPGDTGPGDKGLCGPLPVPAQPPAILTHFLRALQLLGLLQVALYSAGTWTKVPGEDRALGSGLLPRPAQSCFMPGCTPLAPAAPALLFLSVFLSADLVITVRAAEAGLAGTQQFAGSRSCLQARDCLLRLPFVSCPGAEPSNLSRSYPRQGRTFLTTYDCTPHTGKAEAEGSLL